MARLQVTVDKLLLEILNKLKRRNDRAIFVEQAVKFAMKHNEFKEQFTWKLEENLDTKKNESSFKVKFDEDF